MNDESNTIDGQPVVIRRLLWQERGALAAHLERLSETDRYLRFGGRVNDASLIEYANRSDWLQRTVFGAFVGGDLRAAGECQILARDWPRQAELAFSVEAPVQGRGIGTQLFQRLITFARNRRIRRVYLTTLRHNRPMRQIARKFGMTLCSCEDEVEGRMELIAPTPVSFWDEALEEGGAWFWTAWNEAVSAGMREAGSR
ncbi:hypothetical protein KBTX_01010 [wastewater metagenome]|uniref:N-acetyltransferase domain-containing protein n=2 Tax=unclassified sequences TaxID=12908 RepID=A0A5B8RBH0_9ZZZZ|nr:GNAT family N-acetyltransferase [Arhodomonas sp. KWT]QEA04702.1 hypothetical protein KBTEX_01010 [uncultured organism]